MRKILLTIFISILVIIGAVSIKLITANSSKSPFIRGVLEVFSKNEGVIYPKQKLNAFSFPDLSAKSYLAIYEGDAGKKYLVMRNVDQKLPIASITKITTAMVALNSSENLLAQFGANTISEGTSNRYITSDILPVKELVKSMLVESDNDAARAICENESGNIIERMNAFANFSGAESTHFFNCTGLDGEWGGTNTSTASDVAQLMSTLIEKHPELVDIMSLPTAQILKMDGSLHHTAISTYEFIAQELPFPIIGGKTGQTDLAKQNLVLALQAPKGILYIVVLGSDDRVADMKKLAEYVKGNFEW
jgi:serine-type D-Ala-D-Ala carboxypeptidase (penicillin-binding protein 5/6)